MDKSKHKKPAHRRSLHKLISTSRRIGARVEGTFEKYSNGHILLLNAKSEGGREENIWINVRATTMIPKLRPGDRIEFRADLFAYPKKDGCSSVRLEDVREVIVYHGVK